MESELLPDTRYLVFRVIDTGTGFNQEQLDKFNKVPPPHFTKENVKEQIGLGLVMARRIMAEFGGSLRISNNVKEGGQGATGATVELLFRTDREAPPVHLTAASGVGPFAAAHQIKPKAKDVAKPAEAVKAAPAAAGGGKKRTSTSGTAAPAPPPSPYKAQPQPALVPPNSAIARSRGSNTSTGSGGEHGEGQGLTNPLTNAKVSQHPHLATSPLLPLTAT